jgi:hypothetical protein
VQDEGAHSWYDGEKGEETIFIDKNIVDAQRVQGASRVLNERQEMRVRPTNGGPNKMKVIKLRGF